MSEQTKLNVEALAETEYKMRTDPDEYCYPNSAVTELQRKAFLTGHTHATNDANLVPLDKVLGVLGQMKSSYHLEGHLAINEAITQIKNLTKE